MYFTGRDDIIYTGYDLIPINIANAKKWFSNETWSFSTWDLVRDKISNSTLTSTELEELYIIIIDGSFDIIVNRHTAIHLGLYDNIQVTSF